MRTETERVIRQLNKISEYLTTGELRLTDTTCHMFDKHGHGMIRVDVYSPSDDQRAQRVQQIMGDALNRRRDTIRV